MGQQNQLNKGTPDSLQFISSGRSYVDPTELQKSALSRAMESHGEFSCQPKARCFPETNILSLSPFSSILTRFSRNGSRPKIPTADPRKLEHGLRRISARIPYTLP